MKRRDVLGAIGATTTAGMAGCLGAVDPREADLQLGHFWVTNYTETPVDVEVRVERDGEAVHRATYEVDARDDRTLGGASVECTWGDTSGAYVVSARETGGEWASKPLAEVDDGLRQTVDCAIAEASYRGHTIEFWLRDRCEEIRESSGCSFVREER